MADSQLQNTIQSNIKTLLETTDSVENVFTNALGVPRAINPQEFIDKFVEADDSNLQAWFIGRKASPAQTWEAGGRGQIAMRNELWRNHRFQFVGYYSYVSESSEAAFNTIIDDVLTTFNPERTLGAFQATPLSLNNLEFGYLGTVYCHIADFGLEVLERVTGVEPA